MKITAITLALLCLTTHAHSQSADNAKPNFPIANTNPKNIKDVETKFPIDLKQPQNIDTTFIYNTETNRYEYQTTIGNELITTPINLTPTEYYQYNIRKSLNSYLKNQYRKDFDSIVIGKRKEKDPLSFLDMQFSLGPADKIFGPGGVKLDANGNVTIKMGIIQNKSGNPSLTERQRNKTTFDFDTQINTDVKASVGDKLNFNLNYNTESTFQFDQRQLKLGYKGKEDEIIKTLEAGNVSMNTSNSLIRGGAALFGIKTELQFGKLTVGTIFSQQESQAKTISQRGNIQTTAFEIRPDQYEENMHYFLAHHFHDNYDEAMASLPYIKSGINIDRIEVWITNHRSNYDEARNILAFSDLGEHTKISNTTFTHPIGTENIPYNNANDLYANLLNIYTASRDVSMVNQAFAGTTLEGGRDFEKIENARRLNNSDYSLNSKLGYISLNYPLQPDEVLAVAYSYTYRGKTYQIGEFSTDNPNGASNVLYLKMLKGTSFSPTSPSWKLMMKNVYPITENHRALEKDKFRFDIKYKNDTTGVYLNYITEGKIAKEPLLRVENLDRLDSRNEPFADGFFDYVEGMTVVSQYGKIIFPVVEPFGSHLKKKIADDIIAEKYIYQELYDSTLTVARQAAEKNKFIMTGQYKGSANSYSNYGNSLNSRSMTVSANGVRLREGSDYVINNGQVEITNPAYQNANIQQSFEDNTGFNLQRKTMMGLNLNYALTPKFNVGATIMNLSEMPLVMKTIPGQESINNTLFGFNLNYTTQSQLLTNILDKIPLLELTKPSQITLTAEYARLIPGHYKSRYGGDYSYIDDFEAAKKTIDLRQPHNWNLSSTPSSFPESKKTNDLTYGKNRSLMAWYYIDALFNRESSIMPTHIKNDKDQRSNHYVRAIKEGELFPEKDPTFGLSSILPVLNIAYYPKERGPYNLDAQGMNPDGTLANPEKRWGGVTRKIESGQVDFEANNIETIEFWLLDPFIYDKTSRGGDLYFNLGEISEDILKDEKKFFENGLPADGDATKTEQTVWGLVPRQQSLVYAFDNTEGARKRQDVGLDGLSTEDEFNFSSYGNYVNDLRNILSPQTQSIMENDPFSPLRDPAGDNYHYFRGSDFDAQRTPILNRYKHYNGTEGNSADANDTGENFNSAFRLTPDVEDINQDNTLNENEKYFQYHISIRPEDLTVGRNFIVQKKEVSPVLDNGKTEHIAWYQFKIPLAEFESKVGNINDFKTIRFLRMFLTNFSDSVILRFGTFELVYGDWRSYSKDLSNPNLPPQSNASISMSYVNYEEHSSKEPVNYILPPGVNRIIDPGQTQLRQQNEQSLALNISNLAPGDSRAIYRQSGLDTRQYRRLQMFVHAERLIDDLTNLEDDELSVFLRLGSDYRNNYYEYEVPLRLTPAGIYTETSDQQRKVWPSENMLDFPLSLLTDLKLERNREKRRAGSTVSYLTPYSIIDPANSRNTVTIVGNPTLSEVKVIMLGIRNNSRNTKSTEIWFNELRLTEFNEDGGWAGNANLFVGLSDMGSVTISGRKETTGFGSLDQGIMDRNIDDSYQYGVATQVDLGRFLSEKAKMSLPFYYSYTENTLSPKYNPLDQDVLLADALNNTDTKTERDSIRSFAVDKETSRSINFNNVKVDIQSKKPMPYDPANFTFGFSALENHAQNASTQYETTTEKSLTMDYIYSSPFKPWKPFAKTGKKGQADTKFLQSDTKKKHQTQQSSANKQSARTSLLDIVEIGLLPNSFQINSEIYRNYFEMQLRDIGNSDDVNMIPVSFREDFFWQRSLETQWKLTQNLNFSFNSGTNARIETPHEQVNKLFNPDKYSLWRDSVIQSIRNLGRPMEYKQKFTGTYKLPFSKLPLLNFIDGNLSYNSQYTWDRGATLEDASINLGNIITGSRSVGLDNITLKMETLYNKSKFLENANKKFVAQKNTRNQQRNIRNQRQNTNEQQQKKKTTKQKKKFENTITLSMDSTTQLAHQLGTKRLKITARTENGRLYPVKYKKTDNNTIEIKNRDSVKLKISLVELPPSEETDLYKAMQYTARALMLVRSVGFTYTESYELTLPNFEPEIGNFFGQGSSSVGISPGLDFAFGLINDDYIHKAEQRQWLIKNQDNITPAMTAKNQTFKFTAQLEPLAGMKITLDGVQTKTDHSETYFMYSGMPKKFTGTFVMTTIAFGTAFESSTAANGYHSQAFQNFLSNRTIVASRLEQRYATSTYPASGFLEGSYLAGQAYDPNIGAVNLNSTDVLIPAFIAAYTAQNPSTINLSPFPALKRLLPNWRVTYDGLMRIPFVNNNFKSFNIEHKYSCSYTVGAYNSYINWIGAGQDGIGFIENVFNGNPNPSSAYDITAVTLKEDFAPLVGLKTTLQNDLTLNLLYNTNRTVNLNIAAYQIVEGKQHQLTFETGYRINNFNRYLKIRKTGGVNFNNELNVKFGINYSKMHNLIRKIEETLTQATNGDSIFGIKFIADYNLSRMIVLQVYYDRQINNPLVSASAYPVSKSNFGLSVKVSLQR
ncbi:MAG: cell surface protein SprA [Dysgonamonadaceae bacterium]|nr:cell surface protein SprA [Dysgonamonadaceae bacterium]